MKISAGKPVMFVHFVVCLFANIDVLKYFQELSSKTHLQFFFFIKRTFIDRYFSLSHVLLSGKVPIGINQTQETEM